MKQIPFNPMNDGSKKVIGHNTDTDGNSRCIKADYYKMGVANFLYHPNDGFTATCVIEYEVEDEQQSDSGTGDGDTRSK